MDSLDVVVVGIFHQVRLDATLRVCCDFLIMPCMIEDGMQSAPWNSMHIAARLCAEPLLLLLCRWRSGCWPRQPRCSTGSRGTSGSLVTLSDSRCAQRLGFAMSGAVAAFLPGLCVGPGAASAVLPHQERYKCPTEGRQRRPPIFSSSRADVVFLAAVLVMATNRSTWVLIHSALAGGTQLPAAGPALSPSNAPALRAGGRERGGAEHPVAGTAGWYCMLSAARAHEHCRCLAC